MLKKDSIWLGVAVGLAAPLLSFLVLTGMNHLLVLTGAVHAAIPETILYLLSIFINLLPVRIYFVNFKYDKTGRGVLFVTFILMILFFGFIEPA